jgi:hypothetical protein
MNTNLEVAYRLDPVLWVRGVLGETPRPWQEEFLRAARGQDTLVLTARQIGKTTVAAWGMAHTMLFNPGSLSVVACQNQGRSAEAVRKVRAMVLKAGAKLKNDNARSVELDNGSRVIALPGSDDSGRGLTVDGWIVADEAAYLSHELIAAMRPMRAQRPQTRFVMLSTARTRTDPFWSAWESGDQSWQRIAVTVDTYPSLYSREFLDKERAAMGEELFKREYRGIPCGGTVSPFVWEMFERATQRPASDIIEFPKPAIIAHDVGCSRDRSTAVIGGSASFAPDVIGIKTFEEFPIGLTGYARADVLATIDRRLYSKALIVVDVSNDATYAEVLLERFGPRVIGLHITRHGDGLTGEWKNVKKGRYRVYTIGRTHLFDLLLRAMENDKVRILDQPNARCAFEQLMSLEVAIRESGLFYDPVPGRHDDLAISMAMLAWATQHPHLRSWCEPLEPRPPRAIRRPPSSLGWT